MMFNVRTIIFVFLSVIMMQACSDYPCTKADLQFGLVDFSDSESDTIIIRRFAKGNLVTLKDTIAIYNINFTRNNDTLKMVAFPGTALLQSDHDYEIFFPETGKLIRVTEISEEQRHLKKKGIFSTTKEGCMNQITSYMQDGQIKPVSGFNLAYFIH